VLSVQPATNTVVVGPAEALEVTGLRGRDAVWFGPVGGEWFDCQVQVRAHAVPVPARARAIPADDAARSGLEVELTEALRGVAAGQSVVLYDGTRVIGQGTLESNWG
jgi:tRNA-specific 2-thiouridylase